MCRRRVGGRADNGERGARVLARRDGGASLVEFALALPVLALLLFGIIDFGWAFSQNVDLRNAAREGGRLAVVNFGASSDPDARREEIIAEIQERSTDLENAKTEVFVAVQDDDGDGTTGERGETVVVCLSYPLKSLSGLTAFFLDRDITSKAVMRMEQVAAFSSGGSTSPAWTGGTCAP